MRSKLNYIFDKIYVVSYDESSRLETLKDRLDGIEYEVFYGCNKKDINIDKLSEEGYTGHGDAKLFTAASFACTFSHLYLYKKLKEEKVKNVLILEDDIIVVDSALENFYHCYSELPDTWDMLYIGFSNHNRNWDRVLENKKNYKNNLFIKGDNYMMGDHRLLPLEGTNAYAINNNFLDIAIEKQSNPKTMNPIADGLLFYLYCKLEYYVIIPQILPQIDNINFSYKNNSEK